MSLHGPIKVNEQTIGMWSARRVLTADPNVYQCVVERFNGSLKAHHFTIEHRYEDGAVALAAKVLGYAADDQLKVDAIRSTTESEGQR